MRSILRFTTLNASLLLALWAFPGCSSNEGDGGKMDASAKPSGKMGGAMDKGKMEGTMDKGKMEGAMDKDKMGGAMDKDKMQGSSK
jgi:hypothetical protein